MKKYSFIFFFISLLLQIIASPSIAKKSSVSPQNMRCEYLINPKGIDEMYPRLSWTLGATNSDSFGQRQTAYRILVAVSEKTLKNNTGDVWDSGWISSNEMQHIEYKGKPLQSDRAYFWKISIKDEEGRISKWSEPAYWTTGLLNSNEWRQSG